MIPNYKKLDYYKKIIDEGFLETTGPKQKIEGTVKFTDSENEYIYWSNTGIIKKRYSIINVADINIEQGISVENYNLAFLIIKASIAVYGNFGTKMVSFNRDYKKNIKKLFEGMK